MKYSNENMLTFDYSDWETKPGSEKYRLYIRRTYDENSTLHCHDYIEFFYVTEGVGTHILNKKHIKIESGAAALLIPSDVHGFYRDKNTSFRHIDILIETSFFKEACDFFCEGLFDDILNDKFPRTFSLTFEQVSAFNKFVPYIFLPPDNVGYKMASKSLLTSIIQLFTENFFEKSKDNFPQWLVSLLQKLNAHENFNTPLPVLTEEFAYNADYMRRIFKNHLGMTMTDYFNRKRLDYAYHLLKTTDLPVEKICEIIGINNISHFYHLFKKTFNKTPSKVKKSGKR